MRKVSELERMTYDDLVDFLDGKPARELCHHTWVEQWGKGVRVRFYTTYIATLLPRGTIRFQSGYHRTSTTKQRINLFLPKGWYLFQEGGRWYLRDPDGATHNYYENMTLVRTKDGSYRTERDLQNA